jgi:hypothetical protein
MDYFLYLMAEALSYLMVLSLAIVESGIALFHIFSSEETQDKFFKLSFKCNSVNLL